MKTTAFILSWIVLAGLAPSIASHRSAASDFSSEPIELEIAVYVYETCALPPVVEETAKRTAADLFDRIGVRLSFATARRERADSGRITLHLKRAPKKLASLTVGAADIDPGHADAFVFCDRVALFYDTVHYKETGTLLGYAIAHELGHVLLGTPAHSPDGVMKACWRRSDIIPMLQHMVEFSRADAERIHTVRAPLLSANTNRPAPER